MIAFFVGLLVVGLPVGFGLGIQYAEWSARRALRGKDDSGPRED